MHEISMSIKLQWNLWFAGQSAKKWHKLSLVQLKEYETVPFFVQLSQNLNTNCLLISMFLPAFAWCDHKIVLQVLGQNKTILMITSCKNTEINKQSYAKFWFNWIRFGAVSYLLSCTIKCKPIFWTFRNSTAPILHND